MPKVTSVKISDHSPEVLKAMKQQVLAGLEAIGQTAEGYAKDECPVDTGNLRNSISHKVVDDENAVYIGTNVEYGVYVEYGEYQHHTVGKAHFIRDAAVNHGEHYKEIMKAALNT